MSARYVLNQPVVLDCSFTVAGVLTDPTTISLTVTDPTGAATTYTYAGATITRTSTGVYTKTVTGSVVGVWSFVWTGTGTAADVQTGTFNIFATDPQARLYCTIEEAKEWVTISDTLDDSVYAQTVAAVSRKIDNDCGWHFFQSTEARTFTADNRYELDLRNPGELQSVIALSTGITVKTDASGDGTFETTWLASDYELQPNNAPYTRGEAWPWTQVRAIGVQTFPLPYTGLLTRTDRVQITATWGWPSIPDPIRLACKLQTSRLINRRYSPQGVAAFGDLGPISVRTLDPDVADQISSYSDGGQLVAFA